MSPIRTEEIKTAEQLFELPEDIGPCELIRGELVMTNLEGMHHSQIEVCLLLGLARFAKEHGLGRVYPGDTGFILERNKDSVRCPDVAFVSATRFPPEPIVGYFPGPPDLAAEIRSENDKPHELLSKIGHYLDTGVRVVWDIDPEFGTLTVYRTDGTIEQFSDDAILTEPELLPGFSITLKSLFNW